MKCMQIIRNYQICNNFICFHASVHCDGPTRFRQSTLYNVNTDFLVAVLAFNTFKGRNTPQEGDTTSRDNPFLDSSSSGIEGIIDSIFSLVHFHLAGATNLYRGLNRKLGIQRHRADLKTKSLNYNYIQSGLQIFIFALGEKNVSI